MQLHAQTFLNIHAGKNDKQCLIEKKAWKKLLICITDDISLKKIS